MHCMLFDRGVGSEAHMPDNVLSIASVVKGGLQAVAGLLADVVLVLPIMSA